MSEWEKGLWTAVVASLIFDVVYDLFRYYRGYRWVKVK